MATVTGQLQTYNVGNYIGPLFHLQATETPLLSMIGGLTGGKQTTSPEFTWTTQGNRTPDQRTAAEGADATFEGQDREPHENITEIHQEGIEVSYTKLAAVGQLADSAFTDIGTDAQKILGNQAVQDEIAHQTRLRIESVGRDVNYSFHNGTYNRPNDDSDSRGTRGILNAITTNEVDASSADLSKDMIDELLRGMYDDQDAPIRMLTMFCRAYNKQRISSIYGYAPQHRNVGGVNIETIETDFGLLGIVLDRDIPKDTVGFYELSVMAPVFLPTPGKGAMFTEPLAQTGSALKTQLYTDVGLEYGPEQWHGKIINTATS